MLKDFSGSQTLTPAALVVTGVLAVSLAGALWCALWALKPDKGWRHDRDLDVFARHLGDYDAFFAGIPYEWHTNNDIARYEGYYASVFYSYFAALGYEIVVEESSAGGRLDMAVRTGGHV